VHSSNICPSECVFSTVGLIIAKDHARLASDTANELIFYMMPCLQFLGLSEHKDFMMFGIWGMANGRGTDGVGGTDSFLAAPGLIINNRFSSLLIIIIISSLLFFFLCFMFILYCLPQCIR
jgi:hypothetical protein